LVYSPPAHDHTLIWVHRYNAIRTWHKLLTSPDSEYWVQLTPGTAVGMSLHHTLNHSPSSNVGIPVINNHRVLHGRSAFDGKRRMCGAYIGMDEYHSKLAVLQEKFATNSVSYSTGVSNANKRSVWSAAF
jgi:trimethyllysine dioxygenase